MPPYKNLTDQKQIFLINSASEMALNPHFKNFNPHQFPNISKPRMISGFSIVNNRQLPQNYSQLKYLKIPNAKNFKLDLNIGFENRIVKPETQNNKIDHILNYILSDLKKLKNCDEESKIDGNLFNFQFVCFRGLLRLLMCTPYDLREPWIVLAMKYKGTIYLCQMETDEKKFQRLNEDEKTKRFCSYGFKFEQYLLTDNPDIDPETSTPVDETEEFCGMFSTKLEGKNILLAAEMDGIISNKMLDHSSEINWEKLEFVELKVKRRETNERQKNNFYRFKLIKWWCQSFLVGISRVYFGLRDDRGIVDEIDKMNVNDMPKMAKLDWNSGICLDFCNQFLDSVAKSMKNIDSSQTVFKYEWDQQKSYTIVESRLDGANNLGFLPDWYLKQINI